MKNIGLLSFLFLFLLSCAENKQTEDASSTTDKMEYPLKAELTVSGENDYWATITLSNPDGYSKSFHQPLEYKPYEEWEYSDEAYQISVLQSFHMLKMILVDNKGEEVVQNDLRTLADEVFLEEALSKDKTIEINVPLSEFYDLNAGVYSFRIEYGRAEVLATDSVQFEVE